MTTAADRRTSILAVVVLAAAILAGCSSGSSGDSGTPKGDRTTTGTSARPDDALKLNQIQVMGTHNSFHVATKGKEHELLAAMDAEKAAERAYSHPSLTTQIGEQRIRQIELDIFADAKGGLYAHPALREQAGLGAYAEEEPSITKPGTKVLHEQDVDYRSVCPLFVDCLKEVKRWSDGHPGHVPIAIDVQFKDGPLIFPVPNQAKPERWSPDSMGKLDDEIRSVFGKDDLITPDDVRGDHATLEEAVLAGGWPTLGDARGKVLFQILNGEPYDTIYRDVGGVPAKGEDGLEGQVMFTNAQPGQPDASFLSIDDPIEDGARITALVEQGYLVRTRADTPETADGPEDDTARLEAALASGAQMISTDYPGPDGAEAIGSAYVAELPGFLAARCNPVNAPKACDDARVEPST